MNKVYFERSGGTWEARWENSDGDKLRKRFYEKIKVYTWAKNIGASKVIEVK